MQRPPMQGSGVLIDLAKPNAAGGRRATIVTAYHVLHLAHWFTLHNAGGSELAIDLAKATCYVDRSRELAFVRVDIRPGLGLDSLAAIRPDPA